MTHIDVLSVGDAATDVFIRLADPHIRIRVDDSGRWIDLPFGGKVPFEYVRTVEAGGNAANAAVGMARLGLSSGLAAHIGNDQVGRHMLAALRREGVETHLVHLDPGRSSNCNFVLWFGQDRTILVRHQLYDYRWPRLEAPIPRWIYLSSVGSDAPEYYGEIATWLDAHPSTRLVFQPGTFQIAQGVEALHALYHRADLLVCNREEAVDIGGGDHGRVGDLLESLHRIGPKIAVITDGPEGAYASDGSRRYRIPAYPDPDEPQERTGAGDAFTSALVAGLAKGLPLEEALTWGPVNAMRVVQEVGSQCGLLSEGELLEHLKRAPDSYRVTTW